MNIQKFSIIYSRNNTLKQRNKKSLKFCFQTLFLERLYHIYLIPYTICSGKESQELGSKPFPLHTYFFYKVYTRKIKHKLFCTKQICRFSAQAPYDRYGYNPIFILLAQYKYVAVACGCTDPFQLTDIPKISLRTVGIIINRQIRYCFVR